MVGHYSHFAEKFPSREVARPGAALAWRRAEAVMTVQPWRRLPPAQREAVAAEAASLPLPGVGGRIVLRWDD